MKLFNFKKSSRDEANAGRITIPNQRVSVEPQATLGGLLRTANTYLDVVDPKVPYEFLDIIEKFCIVNPDFSQTLSDMVTLGNTGHEIEVIADEESVIQMAADRLNALAARIDTDSLVNKLLRQLVVNGAISNEWVASSDLSGIERAVLVPVKSIRFKYNKESDVFKPFQLIQETNTFIELNPFTYNYSAIETTDTSPYAIPPFVAALGNTIIQLFMMDNIKFIMKKMGLLGLVDVALKMPNQDPGETMENYQSRLTKYLSDFAKGFSENFRDGVSAHYDNMTITSNSMSSDSRGAKDLLQINEEQIASGLKQDPAMLGRSYSTTETYAGVVYSKLVKRLNLYQQMIKREIERGYKIDLLLGGILADISLHFNPSPSLKPIEDATAKQIETDIALAKMDAGIISPDDAARELGYDQAYQSDFAPDPGPESQEKKLKASLKYSGGKYQVAVMRRPSIEVFELSDKKKDKPKRDPEGLIERRRQRWVNKYNGEILQIDAAALGGVLKDLKGYLAGISSYPTDEFAEEVYSIVTQLHPENLSKLGLGDAVAENLQSIYRFYRQRDKLVKGKRIPMNLSLSDRRAIKFLDGLDDFCFSKYLTNKPVRQRMLSFLKTEHLEGRTAKPDSFIQAFRSELGDMSRSHVRNIVDTSVTRLRNWGHIRQLSEAKIGRAEISEVMDSVTCDLCRAMHGKTFSIATADSKIGELSGLSPEDFMSQVYDNAPREWKDDPAKYAKEHSAEDFIVNNMVGPPFHGHCRGRIDIK